MQNTKHYNLIKPDATDYYSINDFNSNADIIDEELNKISTSSEETKNIINNFIEGETSEKIKASNVSIQDAGNNFDSSDVEGALQEVMEEVKKALQNGVDIKDAVRDAINSKLTVPDLPSNATWNDIINSIIQIKEGRGNAQQGDVLQGKTFTNDSGQELTGTMPNRGNGGTITPSTQNQTKPNGYYSSDIVVLGDADLNPNNIKKGVNIFGVTGTIPIKQTIRVSVPQDDTLYLREDPTRISSGVTSILFRIDLSKYIQSNDTIINVSTGELGVINILHNQKCTKLSIRKLSTESEIALGAGGALNNTVTEIWAPISLKCSGKQLILNAEESTQGAQLQYIPVNTFNLTIEVLR